jgi:hypothetical protein
MLGSIASFLFLFFLISVLSFPTESFPRRRPPASTAGWLILLMSQQAKSSRTARLMGWPRAEGVAIESTPSEGVAFFPCTNGTAPSFPKKNTNGAYLH